MSQVNGSDFDPNAEQLFIEPPGWPKVIGIMSIVFGSISVFCGGAGLAMMPFQGSMMEGMLNGDPPPPTMTLDPGTLGLGVVSLLLNVLLITGGIFLINRRAAGRMMHLAYALIFIPVVVLASLNAIRMQGATEAWAETYPNNQMAESIKQQAGMGLNTGLITAVVNLLIGMAWPLFCIIWFGFVKTKYSHMTGQPEDDVDPMDPAAI